MRNKTNLTFLVLALLLILSCNKNAENETTTIDEAFSFNLIDKNTGQSKRFNIKKYCSFETVDKMKIIGYPTLKYDSLVMNIEKNESTLNTFTGPDIGTYILTNNNTKSNIKLYINGNPILVYEGNIDISQIQSRINLQFAGDINESAHLRIVGNLENILKESTLDCGYNEIDTNDSEDTVLSPYVSFLANDTLIKYQSSNDSVYFNESQAFIPEIPLVHYIFRAEKENYNFHFHFKDINENSTNTDISSLVNQAKFPNDIHCIFYINSFTPSYKKFDTSVDYPFEIKIIKFDEQNNLIDFEFHGSMLNSVDSSIFEIKEGIATSIPLL